MLKFKFVILNFQAMETNSGSTEAIICLAKNLSLSNEAIKCLPLANKLKQWAFKTSSHRFIASTLLMPNFEYLCQISIFSVSQSALLRIPNIPPGRTAATVQIATWPQLRVLYTNGVYTLKSIGMFRCWRPRFDPVSRAYFYELISRIFLNCWIYK